MLANHIGDIDIAVIKSFTPLSADVDFLPGIAKKHSFAFVTNTEDVPGMARRGARAGRVCATPTCGWTPPLVSRGDPHAGVVFADEPVMNIYAEVERAVYSELGT